MTASIRIVVLALTVIFSCKEFGFGQGNKTVIWQFEAVPTANHEAVLKFTALVAPGWHLYSQHLCEDGPMPTKFSLASSDDYIPLGVMEENGEATTFYDDIYSSNITWYTGTVSFTQKVRLIKPVTTVSGVVEYMTCSGHSCIPDKLQFKIAVQLKKKH